MSLVVKFEQSDASILQDCFGNARFSENLLTISSWLDSVDVESLENNQTYREIIALKSVLTKAKELSAKINKTYQSNVSE
jgi:hypothetical protein